MRQLREWPGNNVSIGLFYETKIYIQLHSLKTNANVYIVVAANSGIPPVACAFQNGGAVGLLRAHPPGCISECSMARQLELQGRQDFAAILE